MARADPRYHLLWLTWSRASKDSRDKNRVTLTGQLIQKKRGNGTATLSSVKREDAEDLSQELNTPHQLVCATSAGLLSQEFNAVHPWGTAPLPLNAPLRTISVAISAIQPTMCPDSDSSSESCGTIDEDAEPVRRTRHMSTDTHASQWMDRVLRGDYGMVRRILFSG